MHSTSADSPFNRDLIIKGVKPYSEISGSEISGSEIFFEWLTSNKLTERDDNHLSHITREPDVYICDWRSAANYELLKTHNIGYMLSLHPVLSETVKDDSSESELQPIYEGLGVRRLRSYFQDNGCQQVQQIITAYQNLEELYKLAADSKSSLLIHCQAGCSRSPLLFAAYLARQHNLSLKTAVEIISDRRNISVDQKLAINVCRILEINIE